MYEKVKSEERMRELTGLYPDVAYENAYSECMMISPSGKEICTLQYNHISRIHVAHGCEGGVIAIWDEDND